MQSRYEVADLGTLSGPNSVAVALNNYGHVVGQADTNSTRDGKTTRHAFLWHEGRLRDIGRFAAADVNDSDDVVGQINYGGSSNAVICRDRKIKPLLPVSHTMSIAYAINNAGQSVGWSYTLRNASSDFGQAFLRDKSGLRILSVSPENVQSEALCINDHGTAAGSVKRKPKDGTATYQNYAAVWFEGKEEVIAPPPGFNECIAIGINNAGQVLCQAISNTMEAWFQEQNNQLHPDEQGSEIDWSGILEKIKSHSPTSDESLLSQSGFLWEQGKTKLLMPDADSPFRLHISRAMNDHGDVVGTTGCDFKTFSEPSRAFLYSDGQMIDLNELLDPETGWTLLDAKDINNMGQIVGRGEYRGTLRAFLLTPQSVA